MNGQPTTKTYYAVELRLLRLTVPVDAAGARLPAGVVHRQELAAHYDGSRTEADAHALYAACDAQFGPMRREEASCQP